MPGRIVLPTTIALLSLAAAAGGCKSGRADMSRGGLELVYELAPAGADDARASALAESARKVVVARLAAVQLPAVVRVDGRQLRVGRPAGEPASRAKEAKELLGVVGRLELREVQDAAFLKELGKDLPDDDEGPVLVTRENWEDANGKPRGCFYVDAVDEASAFKAFPKDKMPTGVQLVQQRGSGAAGERLLYLAVGAPEITNDLVLSSRPRRDPMATPTTLVKLTPEGLKKLEQLTERIKGKKLAIVLDGKITSAPVIMAPLTGELQIPQMDVGDRNEREKAAALLAAAINAGPLPEGTTLVEERQVMGR